MIFIFLVKMNFKSWKTFNKNKIKHFTNERLEDLRTTTQHILIKISHIINPSLLIVEMIKTSYCTLNFLYNIVILHMIRFRIMIKLEKNETNSFSSHVNKFFPKDVFFIKRKNYGPRM